MNKRTDENRVYEKPELRRVELSLAEIALGTGCNEFNPSVDDIACGPGTGCDINPINP